jgi:hypothetical protein
VVLSPHNPNQELSLFIEVLPAHLPENKMIYNPVTLMTGDYVKNSSLIKRPTRKHVSGTCTQQKGLSFSILTNYQN